MANYIKTYELDVLKVQIHDLATLTPYMTDLDYEALKLSLKENGQQQPIIMYKGKCIDGRHRLKALAELGVTKVIAVNESNTLSESDITNKILNVYERRRHQTSTQKALSAIKYYNKVMLEGEKLSKGAVALQFGISRNSLYLAEQLLSLAGTNVVAYLFEGNKINIGTDHKPLLTDNLKTLINHFKSRTDHLLELSKTTAKSNSEYTDEEITTVNDLVAEVQNQLSGRLMQLFSDRIYSTLNK